MTEIFNTIKNFFIVTIPSFAETHWAVLELSFAALILLFFITTIWVAVRKRKVKKRLLADKATLTENLDEKTRAFEAKEAEYNELYTAYDDLCKLNNEMNLEKTQMLTTIDDLKVQVEEGMKNLNEAIKASEKIAEDVAEKDGLIEDLKVSNEKYKERIDSLEVELKIANDTSSEEIERLSKILDGLNEDYNTHTEAADEHIKKLEGVIEAYEFEIADLKAEVDRLKTFEVENSVLLKALRRFKEEDETPIQETLKRFEEKLNEFAAHADVEPTEKTETPKRRELSAAAKKLGIKNFATWTNEELKREIAKRKK